MYSLLVHHTVDFKQKFWSDPLENQEQCWEVHTRTYAQHHLISYVLRISHHSRKSNRVSLPHFTNMKPLKTLVQIKRTSTEFFWFFLWHVPYLSRIKSYYICRICQIYKCLALLPTYTQYCIILIHRLE